MASPSPIREPKRRALGRGLDALLPANGWHGGPPPGRFDDDAPEGTPPPPLAVDEEQPTPAPEPPRVWTPAEIVEQWRSEGPLVHEATELEALDRLTGGGPVYGSRWYLVGAPDAGKTALLVQVGELFARRGVAVGLLAIDEEPADVAMRLAQRLGFTREECEARLADTLREVGDAFRDVPIRLYGPEHTIESAAAELDAFARGRGARAMLGVDSIQTAACTASLVAAAGRKDLSTREAVTANVRALRDVATRYRLIAVATSEMNRGAYRTVQAADDANDLASAKESGAVEYSARVLVALRSVRGEPDLVELRLAKNKHGPAWRDADDSLFLKLDRRRMRLEPADAPERPDPAQVRDAKGRDRVQGDALAVLEAIARTPGLGVRALYDALRAEHGSFSKDRASVGLSKLGAAVVRNAGQGRQLGLYIDGRLVPADVLSKAPLDRRPALSALTAPEVP